MAMAADEPSQSGSASLLDLTALGIDFGAMVSGVLNPVESTVSGTTSVLADASNLPSIKVPLPIVGEIGVIGPDDGTNLLGISSAINDVTLNPGAASSASSAITGLTINVGQLLGQIPGLSTVFSDLQISMDSLGASTNDDGTTATGTTTLSGADLLAKSPIVSAVTGVVDQAAGAIQPVLDTLSSALGALGPLGAPDIQVNLDDVADALFQQPYGPFGGITIDPKDGSLTFDLKALLCPDAADDATAPCPLLAPDPNTQLFSADTINTITQGLAEAMDSFAKALVDKLTDALSDAVTVSFTPTAVGGLKGEVSLGQLLGLDPKPMDLTGCGPTLPFIGQTCVLPVGPILDVATVPLQAAATMLPTAVQTAVGAVVTPVVTAVSPALGLINDVANVTLNQQTVDDQGTADTSDDVVTGTSGLSVSLLGGSVATLSVGNTTLSAARTPVVNATTPVQAGGTTTVTGSLFTPGEEVQVSLQCPPGATPPVDGPDTVTASTAPVTNADGSTTPAGAISAPLTVPADIDPATTQCQAVVASSEGTFTTPVTVTAPPELKQPDPVTPGGSATTTTGTGFTPGSTPTFDVTGPCTVTANGPADANGTVTVSVSATGVDPATCTVTAKDGATGAPADAVTVTVLDPSQPYIWWTDTAGETIQYVRYGDVAVLNGKQFVTGGGDADRGELVMQNGSTYVDGDTNNIIGLQTDESTDGRAIVQTNVTGTLGPIAFDTNNDPANVPPVSPYITMPVGPYTARAYSYTNPNPAVVSNDATITVFPSTQDITVPAEIPAGATTVPITGTGFAEDEPVTVTTVCHVVNDAGTPGDTSDDTTTDVSSTTQAIAGPGTGIDSGGDITARISVPAGVPAGTACDVTATGVGSGATAGPDRFTVTDSPTIDVPTSVGVDDPTIPITGNTFPAGTAVTIVVTDPNGNPVACSPELDTVTTDGSGNLPEGTQCVLPDGSTPGVYTVTVTEPDGAKATDTVQLVDPQVDPVTPDEIPVTGTVTANGTGFTPGGDVTVTLTAPNGSTIICPPDRTALDPTDATYKADASGNISVPCEIPKNTSGDNVVYTAMITDNSSGVTVDGGQVTVTPPPTITVQSPVPGQPFPDTDGDGEPDPSVPAGGTITVSCDDKFADGENVTVQIVADHDILATEDVLNPDGTVRVAEGDVLIPAGTVIGTGACTPGTARVTVPANTPPEDYTIVATGDESGATATSDLTVDPAPTIDAGTPNPDPAKPGVATAGGTVPFTGSGFTPNGTVTVTVARTYDDDNDPNTPMVTETLCTGTTTADGEGAITAIAPPCAVPANVTPGTYTVTARDVTGAPATDTVTISNPTITDPTPGDTTTIPAGSTPMIYGGGWVPGETVTISVICTPPGAPDGEYTGTGTPVSTGSVSVPIGPLAEQGKCSGYASGSASGDDVVPVTFDVGPAPTINAIPETAGPGNTVPIEGGGYTPNTLAVVQLVDDGGTPDDESDDVPIGDPVFVQIGADGLIPPDATFTIPSTYTNVYPSGDCTDNGNGTTTCTSTPSGPDAEPVVTTFETERCEATGTADRPTMTCTADTPAGSYHLAAVDRWGAVATDDLTIATIEPDPTKPVVPAGQSITVTGSGYDPGSTVPVSVTMTDDKGTTNPGDDVTTTYPCFAQGTVRPVQDAEGNETGEYTGDPVVATTAADTSANPPIPAGSVTATCPIPFDAPAGDYSTKTTVTNTNGTPSTADDFDDTITSENTFEVATPPFLLVNGQTTPTSAVPPAAAGESVPVTAMGIPEGTTGVTVTATPPGGTPTDAIPCTPNPATPDADGYLTGVTCPIPTDAVPGAWTIGAVNQEGDPIPNSDGTGDLTETIQIANPTVTITDPTSTTGAAFGPGDASVPAGGTLDLDGTGYVPNEPVTVQLTQDPDGDGPEPAAPVGDPIAACTTADGTLGTSVTTTTDPNNTEDDPSDDVITTTCEPGIEFPIPAGTEPGNYTVTTTGGDSGATTETPLTVTPAPGLDPIKDTPSNGSVPVTGQDFTPGGDVVVTIADDNGTPGDPSDDTVIGTVTVPATTCAEGATECTPGEITTTVPIPATVEQCTDPADPTTCSQVPTPPGEYTVTAKDPSGAEATTTVEITGPPAVDAPPAGAAGKTSNVEVTGFTPGEQVCIELTPTPTDPAPEPACADADEYGNATIPVPIPAGTEAGNYTVTATGTDSGATGTDTIDIANPNIAVTPREDTEGNPILDDDNNPEVPAGTSIPVTGDGFAPGETVTITVPDASGGDPIVVGTCVADATGALPATCTATPPKSLLPDGKTPVTTDLIATGGSSGASDKTTITVTDSTPPAAPVVTPPTPTVPSGIPRPPISGTGEPGATVTVIVDGSPITCDPAAVVTNAVAPATTGTWTCTPSDDIPDGTHTVTARQTDEAGNLSPTSTPVTLRIDTTSPDKPVITSPTEDDDPTNDTTPTITGAGEPGATVDVTIDDGGDTTVTCQTTVGTDGTWSCTVPPGTPLTEGDYTVTATQTDPAGNVSGPSDPAPLTVDTTPPSKPEIAPPTTPTNDPTPPISGTADPGTTVTIKEGDTVLCTTTADSTTGAWSCDSTTLTDGPHTITATSTDDAGNSTTSDPVTIIVDTTVVPPVITTPGGLTNDPTPTVGGTGEPGSTVTVTDGPTGPTICTATVQSDGTWSCDSGITLTDGDHTITATQKDPAGNTSGPGTKTVTVDTTAPDAPEVTGPTTPPPAGGTPTITGTGDEPGNAVEVTGDNGTPRDPSDDKVLCTATVQQDGSWSCTPTSKLPDGTNTVKATETDPAGNESDPSPGFPIIIDGTPPAKPVVTPPTGPTNDTTPSIEGTGEPGATVTVTDNGTPVTCAEAPVVVAADGSWTCTPTTPMSDGDHTITATQTDPSGNTSPASDPVTITVDTKVVPPVITPPTGPTNDTTPPITGTGEPGSKVTVTDDDGTTVCTATVQADGSWSCSPSTALPDGDHPLTATQTDPAGNTSTPSTPVTVTVDTTPPAAPAITGPADPTADPTPTITGTGEPGATVTVTDGDGTTVCTATVQADGTWSCTPTTPLSDGDHTLTATQTDPAGNTSPPSDPLTVTVDTSTPTLTVPSGPVNAGTDVPISGAGYTPGETVTVTITDDAGNPVGDPVTVTVGPDGTFATTVYVSGYTTPGTYTVTATGETSGITASVPIEIAARVIVSWHEFPVRHRGDTQVYRARGFEPGERVTAVIRSTPIYLPVTLADADGIATWTFTVPADFELDRHSGTATSVPVGDSHTAYFRVVAENLAPTGVSETLLHIAAAAVLMFTTGALLVRKTLKEQR